MNPAYSEIWEGQHLITSVGLNRKYMRSLAALGISPAGSRSAHARKTAQLAEKIFSLYTEGFPAKNLARPEDDCRAGRIHG
jgi:hypothetical protein